MRPFGLEVAVEVRLTKGLLQLVDGRVEMKHLQVELGDEVLHLVHGVQHLHPLGVGVESHLVGSGHGGHPTSEMREGKREI